MAAESWKRCSGQMQRHSESLEATVVQFQLPHGPQVDLPEGWSRRLKAPGEEIYVDPSGIAYTEAEMPEVACALLEGWAEPRTKKALQQVLKKQLALLDVKEGRIEDPVSDTGDAATTEEHKIPKATYHGYDQLDDWHFRGTHPILVNMPLYEYSRWVYRVEFPPLRLQVH